MPRYFIELAYKGTAYHGWQIQPNAPTVQAKLNEALSILTRQDIETTGCGRTDTGVHASLFYAHVDLIQAIENHQQIVFQLNAILPRDIRVNQLIKVADDAHARYDATLRSYSYYILRKSNPFLDGMAWYNTRSLDIDAMNESASICLTHKDFTSFSKTGGQQNSGICHVSECRWIEHEHFLRFTVSANRFLRGMVRTMVGSMLETGLQKISIADFQTILLEKNRCQAGESVPAEGLYLEEIRYPYLETQRQFPFLP